MLHPTSVQFVFTSIKEPLFILGTKLTGHSAELLNYAYLNIFYLCVSMPNQSKQQSQSLCKKGVYSGVYLCVYFCYAIKIPCVPICIGVFQESAGLVSIVFTNHRT